MRDLDLDMKPTKVEDDGSKVFVLTLIYIVILLLKFLFIHR